MGRLLATAAAMLLAACPPSQQGPEPTFRRFVAAVQGGEVDLAWSLLSTRTRTALESYVEHQRSLGADLPASAREAVLGDARLARPIESLSVKQAGEDRTVLSVTSGGVTDEVALVREDGGWRIDLAPPPVP